jgi:hypothetical protein
MKSDSREFFEQLGNLFYSLATDRSIEPIEFSELKLSGSQKNSKGNSRRKKETAL